MITGCDDDFWTTKNHHTYEEPHLYWKDIDVEVIDISTNHWYGGNAHRYEVRLTVYSEEYDLTEKITITGSGMWNKPKEFDYTVGQTIKAELFSWVMDSTGEVVRRKINKLY
ncbi:hypothetical protein J6A31_00990 [bacterium]|nr:hypothetical protein [bacterium]